MKKQENYGGLDLFRIAAALLVITIHTSPLASFTEAGDFFLTRVLARIAVPFFFMVTGQFTSSKQFTSSVSVLWRLKKLCLLYGAAILLYLPLGIYAGHYRSLNLGDILRMLLFDGTFYHLWYFPACILGVLLIALCERFLSLRAVTVLTVLLYAIGLLGDSYFGLAEKLPFLQSFYEGLFHVSSYTRNGLFFAPLFLAMGAWMGRLSDNAGSFQHNASSAQDRSPAPKAALLTVSGLVLSFLALTAEAFLLRHFALQRHDSMYLFLPPTLFFLYRCLLFVHIPPRKNLRTVSSLIYLLHPLFIVLVRGAAKALHLTDLLVENSLLHFLAVTGASAATGFALVFLRNRLHMPSLIHRKSSGSGARDTFGQDNLRSRQKRKASLRKTARAWIELDLSALENNVRYLKSLVPEGCRLMPAVKANAYGHGADIIAKSLNHMGIDSFCVACAEEGVQLRKAGVKGEILILGYTHPSQLPLLTRHRLTQTVVDFPYAEQLQKSGLKLHVHIAVDTGMHRLGIRCEDYERIASVYEMKNLSVDGIFTHLSACDSDKPECRAFTESQIQAFYQVTDHLKSRGCPCRGLHLLSSCGVLNYSQAAEDFVRPGIALYGALSAEAPVPGLQPVLSLKTRVTSVRTLYAGESAGYGIDFVAGQNMRIAALSIGYADGLPGNLSERRGYVLIDGCAAPIIGRICMDQTLVDVSRIPHISQGDIAVIIGKSKNTEITAAQLAKKCDTITNELLSRLGTRLDRISF